MASDLFYHVEGGHIEKVHDKTLEAEQVLAEHFAKEEYGLLR